MSLSPSELLLLEFLTAVEAGNCREDLVPTDGLIAHGYIVPVDGRVCLTMAGIAKLWSLRERKIADRVVRQNASLDPEVVVRVVRGQLV